MLTKLDETLRLETHVRPIFCILYKIKFTIKKKISRSESSQPPPKPPTPSSLYQCCSVWKNKTFLTHLNRIHHFPTLFKAVSTRHSGNPTFVFTGLISDTRLLSLTSSFFIFQISTKLRELSNYRDESKVFLTTLAEKVEDFSVAFMDQISREAQTFLTFGERSDFYTSLLDRITESAIRFEQKKVLIV